MCHQPQKVTLLKSGVGKPNLTHFETELAKPTSFGVQLQVLYDSSEKKCSVLLLLEQSDSVCVQMTFFIMR